MIKLRWSKSFGLWICLLGDYTLIKDRETFRLYSAYDETIICESKCLGEIYKEYCELYKRE